MVDELVVPIHPETHKLALDWGVSNDTAKLLKKAPVTGGCRVEGYVRVKKVKPSELQEKMVFLAAENRYL